MDGDVVFEEGENDPTRLRRSNSQKAGQPLGELIAPGPGKDKGQTEKLVLGFLGVVLVTSVVVAVNTQPKEVVVLTPLDAPANNPSIIRQ